MSGPRRSLGEYLTDRCAQLGDLGAFVTYVYVVEFGDEANIHATLVFGRTVRLDVFEHVQMRTGRPHRLKYSYHLERDGEYVVRYDRDPSGHPELPEHKHMAGQDGRKPCGRMTLHDVAEEAWALV